VRVFPKDLARLRLFYQNYANKWKKMAEENGGKNLNFNSPKQMVNLFCVKRGHKTRSRTASGQPSIDNSELLRMSKKDVLAKAILEYKAGNSMIVKFINAYERFMCLENGIWVLHPNFHQLGTRTARLSCSDPNLQQAAAEGSVKRKADIGLKPREAIGPRPGCVWYLPDFSQMEVWIFALAAKYKVLMDALISGKDIHGVVAEWVWGDRPDYSKNQKAYRKKGKTMMFLKQYGGTSLAASELMDCPRYEAQAAIDEFDYKLPGINAFIEQVSLKIEQHGYIENLFGRQYYIDRNFAYKGVNYLVQGTCAEIIKRAMIRLGKKFRDEKMRSRTVLTIHDEIPIEVPLSEHSERLQKDIVRIMQMDSKRIGLPVPLPVTMKIAVDRWANSKESE
jgi:DNA polymerase-1